MLDIKFIREHPDLVAAGARKKHIDFDVQELLKADEAHRRLLAEIEELRSKHNRASERIATLTDETEKEAAVRDSRELKDALGKKEYEFKKVDAEWHRLMLDAPNVPDPSVPDGENDRDNVEIRKWGTPATFDFTPRDHITLAEHLDLVDLERGTKVGGFRGYFLKNEAVRLSMALWQLVFDQFKDAGYTPILA